MLVETRMKIDIPLLTTVFIGFDSVSVLWGLTQDVFGQQFGDRCHCMSSDLEMKSSLQPQFEILHIGEHSVIQAFGRLILV